MTLGLVQPHTGPRLIPNSTLVAAVLRRTTPAQSIRSRSAVAAAVPGRGDGRTRVANAMAASSSGTWPAKITRQPKCSMSGPPMASPSTGPPAPTSDQYPNAFTRSSRSKTLQMMAIDAAPVAAPSIEPMVRTAMREPALHAKADNAEAMAAPAMPSR